MADAPVEKPPVPCAPDLDQDGVDLAQIRQMLDLTPAERLRTIAGFMSSLLTLRSRNDLAALPVLRATLAETRRRG